MKPVAEQRWRLAAPLLILGMYPACSSAESLGGGIHMEPIEGAIKLEAEARDETFFGALSGNPKVKTKETIFREAIELQLDGDVYHSRLFAYRAFLDLGFEQRDLRQNQLGEPLKTNLTNSFFDLRGEIFAESAYSGDVYAFRNQIQTRQSFFASTDAIIAEYGANVRAREWVVPSWLHYDHYTYDGRLGDTRQELRDRLRLQGSKLEGEFLFDYRLEYNFIDGNTATSPYDDYQAYSSIGWNFGPDLQHLVRATGFYRQQTGDFANESADVSGTLDLALSENLDWKNNILFNRTIYEDTLSIPGKKTLWDSYLEHRLFDSLTSMVGLEGYDQYFGEGQILRNGVKAGLDYVKKTSFGQLNIGWHPEVYIQSESGNPDRLNPVADESHRFTIGIPIFLDNLRAEATSIRITDVTGLVLYVAPSDYVVLQSGLTTEIVISVGSRIQPGDTILVSYRYAVGSDRKFRTVDSPLSVTFGFGEFMKVGFFWLISRQNLLEGREDGTLDDVDELGLNFGLNQGGYGLNFDFLDRESRITPFRRFRLDARASFLPDPDVNADLDAGIYRILNKDTDTWEWGLSAGGVGKWRITNRLTFRLSALFKRIDRSTDLGRGWYADGRLSYDLGKTTFELQLIGSQERWQFQNDNDIYRVYFKVRREF